MEKAVLAYSGGLDTSVILKWLMEKEYDVVCYVANVGQDEDFKAIREKAFDCGASEVFVEDLTREFVEDYVYQALKSNAVYEGRYLLGTSIARPLIAKRHVEVAEACGTNVLSHGATGKGNDQVRFELTYYTLMPEARIIVPWRDQEFLAQFEGRSDMIEYAKRHGIDVKATVKKPYSSDPNIMHVSYEAGELEDPVFRPREDMFEMTVSPRDAPDREALLDISFVDGEPVKVEAVEDGTVVEDSVEILKYLNKVGGANGVGRIDVVENRYVGMKSRGVYETPGYTVLRCAHMDLEALTMDREVMRLRNLLAPKISELIYNGYWFSPEMRFLNAALDESQREVTGTVTVSLYKGNCMAVGRRSQESLYDMDVASMDVAGDYDPEDATGFIKLNSLRLRKWAEREK